MEKTENELIAEFMGLEWNSYERLKRNYDSNWNELMPVVEKIETGLDWKYEVLIEHDLFAETNLYSVTIYDVGKATCIQIDSIKSKIKAVYKAVVEFIKWHNSQKL